MEHAWQSHEGIVLFQKKEAYQNGFCWLDVPLPEKPPRVKELAPLSWYFEDLVEALIKARSVGTFRVHTNRLYMLEFTIEAVSSLRLTSVANTESVAAFGG